MNVDNYNAYVKMLANGIPIEPFNILIPKSPEGNPEQVSGLKQLSYAKYGKDRISVENEILGKYKTEI